MTGDDEVATYVYDSNDRLLKEAFDTTASGGGDTTAVYAYGAANAGTEQTKKTVWQGADTNPATGTKVSETSLAYDAQGRLATTRGGKGVGEEKGGGKGVGSL